MRFIGDGLPAARSQSEARVAKALAHWREHGFGTYGVRLRNTGEFVGRCGFVVQELEDGSEIELGYVIARRFWSQGYAAEATTALRDHATQHLGVRRLIALIDSDNEASIRVASKLGLVYEKKVRFGTRWRVLGRMTDLYTADLAPPPDRLEAHRRAHWEAAEKQSPGRQSALAGAIARRPGRS